MKKHIAIVALTLLAAFAAYELTRPSLAFSIDAQQALKIVESNEEASKFIKQNLANESERITRAALVWNQSTNSYLWEVELMERACGCKVNVTEGLTILKAQVNPRTGEILNLSMRKGVEEETYARETCMRGCHAQNGVPKAFS